MILLPLLPSRRLLLWSCFIHNCIGFLLLPSPQQTVGTIQRRGRPIFYSPQHPDNDNNHHKEELLDWRAFRAKLVMGEESRYYKSSNNEVFYNNNDDNMLTNDDDDDCDPSSGDCDLDGIGKLFFHPTKSTSSSSSTTGTVVRKTAAMMMMTPLDPSQWAYESNGAVIERGTVILGGVEQDFGFGLRQQYFHKAAILVVDHQESSFTKGIILNRPTDLELHDDLNPDVKWKLWYGGDVQGIDSENPDFVCIHSLKSEQAMRASIPIMNDIQWTTFQNAKRLVKLGVAKTEDFQVFCGYAGWGPGQLMSELDRKSWYMVATDSQTLLKELAQSASSDPRDAGLETWSLLMSMIGRGEMIQDCTGGFDDLMLKEWSLKHLLSNEDGGGAGEKVRDPKLDSQHNNDNSSMDVRPETLRKDSVDLMMNRASASFQGQQSLTGSLIRASPVGRSPFLLENQEMHKSVILVLSDDDKRTTGVILNRPSTKAVDVRVSRGTPDSAMTVSLPLRFGGQEPSQELSWFHCSLKLRATGLGTPIGPANPNIWKCTVEDVARAISHGLATADDFLVVIGTTCWEKDDPHSYSSLLDRFEAVPIGKTHDVWDSLVRQECITADNLKTNLAHADDSWSKGSPTETPQVLLPTIDNRFGNTQQDDALVFKSDVKVSKLADDALKNWVATFLLGVPIMDA